MMMVGSWNAPEIAEAGVYAKITRDFNLEKFLESRINYEKILWGRDEGWDGESKIH